MWLNDMVHQTFCMPIYNDGDHCINIEKYHIPFVITEHNSAISKNTKFILKFCNIKRIQMQMH